MVRVLWSVDWGGEIFVFLMQTTAVNMVIKVKGDIREKDRSNLNKYV